MKSMLDNAMPARLSRHARERMQQRAIKDEAVSLVLDYGDHVRSRGASLCFFTPRSRRRITRELGPDALRQLSAALNIIVVENDDGTVVTVAHRTRRVRSDIARRAVRNTFN